MLPSHPCHCPSPRSGIPVRQAPLSPRPPLALAHSPGRVPLLTCLSPWAASGSAPRRRHSSARSHPVISSLCLARPRPRDPSPLQPIVHGPSPALNAGFALPTPPPRSLAPRRVSPDNARRGPSRWHCTPLSRTGAGQRPLHPVRFTAEPERTLVSVLKTLLPPPDLLSPPAHSHPLLQ